MKRNNHLIPQIAEMENLRLAFWKARKGKEAMLYVDDYRKKLEANLVSLSNQINNGQVAIGNYHYFTIYDPKERIIGAAPFNQRVLHHALMNVCHPIFEKYQIFDSYASRLGKGTYTALNRAASFQKQFAYFLKLDVRKYFDSIDQQTLTTMLAVRFKEDKLLRIFYDITDSYQTQPGKGVPIGNLTSQYFANHYLGLSDHFVKEKLCIKAYVRYMDDMVLWGNNKDALLAKGKLFESFILEKLQLVLKPFCLNSSSHGLPFLGYTVFPNKIHLNTNSRKRFKKKLVTFQYNLNAGIWSQQDYQKHVGPLLAFTNHANTFSYRQQCLHDKIKRMITEREH